MLYDDTQYLLALALADNAFRGIDCVDDFWQLQIPSDESEPNLRLTDSAKRVPVLRNATMQQGFSEEPISKKTFDRIIKSVLNLSGYFGSATVHAIRRYLGKKVNGKLSLETNRTHDRLALTDESYREVHRSRKIPAHHADRYSCI